MKLATPPFSEGDRVEMSELGRRLFPKEAKNTGVVTSISGREYITVHVDGQKHTTPWFAGYWRTVKNAR